MNRYHVVVVSKYLGMYRASDPTAYAIADHERANGIVSKKYDSKADAERDAKRLNAGTLVSHAEVKRRLLGDSD